MPWGRWATAALVMSIATRSHAQIDYEARHGNPIDVSLHDLYNLPDAYDQKAVRVSARMNMGPSFRSYVLEDAGASVLLLPLPDIAPKFMEAAFELAGQKIEVTGVFLLREGNAEQLRAGPRGAIEFWSYLGPPEEVKGPIKAPEARLEALVTRPGDRDGQTITVVGQFRGRNLYGDLPARSQRDSDDWVIKDDVFAIWISDHKPKGDGFALDAGLKRDTGKWLEIVGKPDTRGGVTYLRAIRVALALAPSATAQAQPSPPPPEPPKLPPVVVFATPLDGEAIAPDARFSVQFSKDMDQASFQGRVLLRYAGPIMPGDRGFRDLRLSYDEGRRALMIDPGGYLRPGRDVELLLLPGITDTDGLTLRPRSGSAGEEAVDILRFNVAG